MDLRDSRAECLDDEEEYVEEYAPIKTETAELISGHELLNSE